MRDLVDSGRKPRDIAVSTRPPPPLTASGRRALDALHAQATFGEVAGDLMNPESRTALILRRDLLAGAMRPASVGEIVAVMASLDGMIARGEGEREAAASARRDLEDLDGLPAWALEQAAIAFRRGDVGEGRFRPTAGELRREAMRRVGHMAEERGRIEKVLAARVIPERKPENAERRRELADRLRKLGNGGALAPDPSPDRERGDARGESRA